MDSWKATREVARWEFGRYIKPKQQLFSILFTMVVTAGFMLISRYASGEKVETHDVAVIGAEQLPVLQHQPESVRFTTHGVAEEAALRARVAERDLAGVLLIRSPDDAELVIRRSGDWTSDVRTALAAARQQFMTERAGLSRDALVAILTPPQLEISYEDRAAGETRGERIVLVVVLVLMLMSVFIGMGYIFASITGEKQIRVTEQVISAIPAQSWIDGKIIGLVGVSLISVLGQVLAFLVVYQGARSFADAPALPLPDSLGEPLVIATILLFAILGLFLWFAYLGAIAAMIDDPQHSTRGTFIMVPLFASMLPFMVLKDLDGGLARVLSLFPATSPSAMPARMLGGDVGTLEVVLSLLLLVGAVLLLRLAAGRVFRLAMLMYGKEPTWGEVKQWVFR